MIDSHAHLDDQQFDADRHAVVQRALQAGVEAILCVGTTAATSEAAVRVAETYSQVYAAVGIHPNSCAEAGADDWPRITALLQHPRVVAMGETGLDRYWDFAPIELQTEYFVRHLQLAQQRDLPVVIHCREAQEDVLSVLRAAVARAPLRAVLHAFSGDAAMAAECLELGLHVSFAGNVTYTNKKFQTLRTVAAGVAANRILIETDSPYLTPEPLRGRQKRNEPALMVHTASQLAALRGIPLDQFAAQTTQNARQLFRLG
ncbi:MAG: TatD family hydrolase [Thermoguttaceae bacterium]|jgi:TatD DNase family protein